MTGSGLLDFVIAIVLLLATGFVFFLVIDRIAPDETLNKIGKIAVGVILLVVFLIAIKGVLFGGGGGMAHMDPKGFLFFCIGIIVILVVLYLIGVVLDWIAAQMGASGELVKIVKYVIFAIALIAMLVLADQTLLGGGVSGSLGLGDPKRIMR